MIDYFKNIVDRTLGEAENVKPPVIRLFLNDHYVDPLSSHSDEGDDPPSRRKHARYFTSTSQGPLEEGEHINETNTHPKSIEESESKEMRNDFNSPPDRLVPGKFRSNSPSILKSEPFLHPIISDEDTGVNQTSTGEPIPREHSLSQREVYNTIVNTSGIVRNEHREERNIFVKKYTSNTLQNRFFSNEEYVKDKETLTRFVQPKVTEDKNNINDNSPVVNVSIGKIEIKPKQREDISKKQKKSVQYTPSLSLGTYLKNMSGRKP